MPENEAIPVDRPLQAAENVPDWRPVKEMTTCPNGHEYPIMAGECPYDDPDTAAFLARAADPEVDRLFMMSEPLTGPGIPQMLADWVASDIVAWKDNSRAPRTMHDYGYGPKVGIVNHIPVCQTLAQLTGYFNGGTAEGSTHFGIGRDQAWNWRSGATLIPCADVHQYMPLRDVAPWAQGVIAKPTATLVKGRMKSGEPNGAFASVENVAMTGADGMTDAQFNSNVLLRAYLASLDGYEITPGTQVWHAEIDAVNRPNDPGWPGDLEDAAQNAARLVLAGDYSGLRGTSTDAPVDPPKPPKPPEPPKPGDPMLKIRLEPISTEVRWTDQADVRELAMRVRIVRDE